MDRVDINTENKDLYSFLKRNDKLSVISSGDTLFTCVICKKPTSLLTSVNREGHNLICNDCTIKTVHILEPLAGTSQSPADIYRVIVDKYVSKSAYIWETLIADLDRIRDSILEFENDIKQID